jgi:hypothetical protein
MSMVINALLVRAGNTYLLVDSPTDGQLYDSPNDMHAEHSPFKRRPTN